MERNEDNMRDDMDTAPQEQNAVQNDSDEPVSGSEMDSGALRSDGNTMGKKSGLSMTSAAKIAGGLAIVGLIVVLGVLFFTGVIKLPGGSELGYDPQEVVASVNGAPILRGELESRVSQVETAYEAQGAPAGEQPELRTQILDELVQTALLKQKAEEAGVTVEESEVEAEYQNLVGLFGGEEALQEQLTMLDIGAEQLRADIHDQVLIQKYLESVTDIENVTVTEEELQAEYDASVAGAAEGEAPAFEEVRDLIDQQLRQQKTQSLVQAHIDELVAQANIEKNI